MPRKLEDLSGQTFGRLIAIDRTDPLPDRNMQRLWRCLCECGRYTNVKTSQLKNGTTRSCGCLRRDYLKSGKCFGGVEK